MNTETIEKLIFSTFSGNEEHQELRFKIASLAVPVRTAIKELAIERGITPSKKVLGVAESIYWIINKLIEQPYGICYCGNKTKSFYYSMKDGYTIRTFCSCSCRSRDPLYKAQLEKTNLEKHGHKNNMHGSKIRVKTEEMWVEKYGSKYPIQNKAIQQKSMDTNKARSGFSWPAQDPLVREKYKVTMLERFGVDNSFKTGNSKKTCLERYGVENPMSNPEIFRKTLRGLKRTKLGVLPSGNEYTYQGYENVAVELLLEKINESQLIIGDPTKIPVIEYWNPVKNKLCHYFPDIWIPDQNLIIEVKSTWTMKRQLPENIAKHQASIKMGFNHEIWICSKTKLLEIAM